MCILNCVCPCGFPNTSTLFALGHRQEERGHGQCAYLVARQVAEDVVGGDADGDLVDGEEGRVAQAVQPSVGPVIF